MALAAQAANTIHAPDILAAVTDREAPQAQTAPETIWQSERGQLRGSRV